MKLPNWWMGTCISLIWAYGYSIWWQTFPGNIMIMIRLSPVVESGLSNPRTIFALTNNSRPSDPKPTPPSQLHKGLEMVHHHLQIKAARDNQFLGPQAIKGNFFSAHQKIRWSWLATQVSSICVRTKQIALSSACGWYIHTLTRTTFNGVVNYTLLKSRF